MQDWATGVSSGELSRRESSRRAATGGGPRGPRRRLTRGFTGRRIEFRGGSMRRLLVLLMLATMVSSQNQARADERLPTDPALVTGTLPNGLSYIVRPHKNPEGRVSIWLNVSSGSLNETDATRGLAHYLEHMAFNGSANFPPGSVVPFFQSLGLAFGRDQNAFTSFDQTTYQLTVPGAGKD